MAGLAAIVGLILSGAQLSILFLYAFLAVFFLSGAGMVINDYYDLEIDKINAPHRPLPSGRISKKNALFYSILLFTIGIFFSALLNVYCLFLALFNALLEIFYSRNFKKIFLLGNIMVSWFSASTFLFGALLTFNFRIIGIISLLTFLITMGREIYKSIEDTKGDRKMGLDTLPIAVGVDSARDIARGFIASAILVSPLPYSLGFLNVSYLIIVSLGNILLLYALYQDSTKITMIIKMAMFIALLAFLFGKFV
jgi:geranylgeranylglycerol-phosphate geranylgeranyltransferase